MDLLSLYYNFGLLWEPTCQLQNLSWSRDINKLVILKSTFLFDPRFSQNFFLKRTSHALPVHNNTFVGLFEEIIFGCAGSSLLCTGFSLWWFSYCRAWALGPWASVVVLHGMWNLPRPGTEPMSPALTPRKSQDSLFNLFLLLP